MTGEGPISRIEALVAFVARTLAAATGATAVAALLFGRAVLTPGTLASQAPSHGLLGGAIFAFVRAGRPGAALVLACVNGGVQGYLSTATGGRGWSDGFLVLLVGCGMTVTAIVFDELARSGLRIGKFLVVGVLLGGVHLAIGPVQLLLNRPLGPGAGMGGLLATAMMGLLIGDGIGIGVELVELVWKKEVHR